MSGWHRRNPDKDPSKEPFNWMRTELSAPPKKKESITPGALWFRYETGAVYEITFGKVTILCKYCHTGGEWISSPQFEIHCDKCNLWLKADQQIIIPKEKE